jgi:hypothetical protein
MGWSSGGVSFATSMSGGWYVCAIDDGRDEFLLPAVFARVRGGVGDSVFRGGSSNLLAA